MPTIWAALSAIGQILEAAFAGLELLVLIVAGVLAVRQLREMTNARHLDATEHLNNLLGTDDVKKARKFVYLKLSGEPEALTEEEWAAIEKVSNSFDSAGLFLAHKLFPEKIVMEMYHEGIIRSWDILGPYIHYRREKRSMPLYQKYFEWLAERAQLYRCRHYPDVPLLQPHED